MGGFAVAVVLLLSGCPSGEGPEPIPGTCQHRGKMHPVDATFPAGDGCNSCTCLADGGVACTLIACDPQPEGCTYGGANFALGARFPAEDGCNTCTCTTSGVSCTEKACQPQAKACVRGGCSGQLCIEEGEDLGSTCEFREEYACYAKAKCERQPNGKCGHTPSKELDACLASTGDFCAHEGEWKRVGESFPSSDGCNTCTCTERGVVCTKRACVPEEPKPCVRSGCSGQLCGEEKLVSTCEFKPEYACYQKATCERQKNGQCGFTPTTELVQCLGTHGTCMFDGGTVRVGDTFPSADGCNSCVCTNDGVACTARACGP